MFLNKKAITKIALMSGAYILLSILCLGTGIAFSILFGEADTLIPLGIVCFCLGISFIFWGRFAEGKGKLLAKGNKLIYQQLHPAEFIALYEEKRDDPTNVVAKPDFDVFQMLLSAYLCTDSKDKALETLEQMLVTAPAKKIPLAKLSKVSILYDLGSIEEANILYEEMLNAPLNGAAKYFLDCVAKSDRAMALGDYVTAEAYYKQALTRTFPKSSPLALVLYHANLANLYLATDRPEDALPHLKYCIENGGETSMRYKAANQLRELTADQH